MHFSLVTVVAALMATAVALPADRPGPAVSRRGCDMEAFNSCFRECASGAVGSLIPPPCDQVCIKYKIDCNVDEGQE